MAFISCWEAPASEWSRLIKHPTRSCKRNCAFIIFDGPRQYLNCNVLQYLDCNVLQYLDCTCCFCITFSFCMSIVRILSEDTNLDISGILMYRCLSGFKDTYFHYVIVFYLIGQQIHRLCFWDEPVTCDGELNWTISAVETLKYKDIRQVLNFSVVYLSW